MIENTNDNDNNNENDDKMIDMNNHQYLQMQK